jgi:hypothetical protein
MPTCEMLCHVTLVVTDVSDERIIFIIRVEGIGELGTTLAIISNLLLLTFLADSFHHDDGSYTLLRNFVSYKSHTVSRPIRSHSSYAF